MMNKKSLQPNCRKCGEAIYQGFARCHNPACRKIRDEFVGHEDAIVDETTICIFSGAETDVQLPNGDGIWAPYFLAFIEEGLIGRDLRYTEAFYEKYPGLTHDIG